MTLLKKPYLAGAFNGLQQCSFCCPYASSASNKSSTSPQNLPAERARPFHSSTNKRRKVSEPSTWVSKRAYATVKGGGRGGGSSGVEFRDNMNWPCRNGQPTETTGANPFIPSPYDIFDMHRKDGYGKGTKLKYYELVKIYHPDRNGLYCEGLNHNERLERYRLIVLAHEILSDPDRRRAYDSYGAGWGSRATTTRHSRGYSNTASGKQYGQGAGFDNSPFANATWEDWERWYRQQATGEQRQAYRGIYVNPNAFAAFVITAAVLSGILQATRITEQAGAYADRQLAFTEETTRFMSSRASSFDDKQFRSDDRVKHFLEKRDPTRYGLKDEEEVQYRKHFSDTDNVLPLGRSRKEVASDNG